MSDEKPKIIIRKIIRRGEGGGHGGSWKVAYADFVTAMMAFFLLLWLISMVAPEKKLDVSNYFKTFTIFQKSGTSFMEKSSALFKASGQSTLSSLNAETQTKEGKSGMKPEEFKEAIKKVIEVKLGDIKDQILVDIFEGGVRIQLVDKAGKPMFELGSSKPTAMAQRILSVIGENIQALPNAVYVEGHTDSVAYRSSTYGNWELSTERALTARKELEGFGLSPTRLTRVAGYADTIPLIKEDPEDPRNRRISIILVFPQKSPQ